MKKSAELKQLRAAKIEAQKALHTKAEAEKRSLNETETAEFRTLQTEIEGLSAQITDAENYETNLRSVEGANPVPGANAGSEERGGEKPKAKKTFSLNKAIRSLVNGVALEGAELEANERGVEAARAAGIGVAPSSFTVPLFESRADGQTVTEDSGAYGGNTVATNVLGPIDYLRPKPTVVKLGAVLFTGLQGNVQFPKNNGGVTATWEDEVDEVTNTKTAWGKIEMKPRRLSVSVLISLQNLMQSSFDMELYTMNEIRKAIEVEIDKDGLYAILDNADVNSVAIGTNGGALTLDKAIDMETAVFTDNADSDTMNYVSNSKVRGKAKKTKIEDGQTDKLLQNNEINGYNYANSNHIPSNLVKGTSGSVCSALIFGDFSKLLLGQWGFMDLSVDDKSRKKEGYIEVTANVYLDSAVLQPDAFAVCKDITTT
jgi:HK97 family phage major capsid protein